MEAEKRITIAIPKWVDMDPTKWPVFKQKMQNYLILTGVAFSLDHIREFYPEPLKADGNVDEYKVTIGKTKTTAILESSMSPSNFKNTVRKWNEDADNADNQITVGTP